jgi:uncharacterized membrane protein
MREEVTAHRLAAYSDAVFAVIVTVMVLELRAPDQAAFSALWPLWPTAISYAVSYLFIAIIWINHHYLMRFVSCPTLGLIWINFFHPCPSTTRYHEGKWTLLNILERQRML